jgi:hypothetical protein
MQSLTDRRDGEPEIVADVLPRQRHRRGGHPMSAQRLRIDRITEAILASARRGPSCSI